MPRPITKISPADHFYLGYLHDSTDFSVPVCQKICQRFLWKIVSVNSVGLLSMVMTLSLSSHESQLSRTTMSAGTCSRNDHTQYCTFRAEVILVRIPPCFEKERNKGGILTNTLFWFDFFGSIFSYVFIKKSIFFAWGALRKERNKGEF